MRNELLHAEEELKRAGVDSKARELFMSILSAIKDLELTDRSKLGCLVEEGRGVYGNLIRDVVNALYDLRVVTPPEPGMYPKGDWVLIAPGIWTCKRDPLLFSDDMGVRWLDARTCLEETPNDIYPSVLSFYQELNRRM